MKRRYILGAAALLSVSCQGTWVMYDTTQPDHVYFS